MSLNYSHIIIEQITRLQQNCIDILLQMYYIQSDLVLIRRMIKLIRMSNSLFSVTPLDYVQLGNNH